MHVFRVNYVTVRARVRFPAMRTILFDWDGTIVDSVGALYDTDAVICRRLGLPFDLAIYRRTFSPNWRLMYSNLGIPEDRVNEAVGIWREVFRPERVLPFDGVRGALVELARAGFVVGLVTGGSRPEIEPQLARIGVDGLLAVRVYGDDTPSGKPDPAPLRLALQLCGGVDASESIYVGDALDDMRMAASAGAHGVGITSMLATAEDLMAAGARESAGSVVEWSERFLNVRGPLATGDAEPL
jgi:phosphoglycolate phosphatase